MYARIAGQFGVGIIAGQTVAPTPHGQAFDLKGFAIWFGVVVVLVSLTLIIMKYARKGVVGGSESADEPAWDLAQLRDLRNSGELTLKEYDRLRDKTIRQMTSTVGKLRGETPMKEGKETASGEGT